MDIDSTKTKTLEAAAWSHTMTPRELVSSAYEEHRDAIYRHVVVMGIAPAVAQEMVQDAFLKLFVEISKGTAIQSFRAWLLSVSHRLALNHLRAQSYRPEIGAEEFLRWIEAQADPNASPEARLLRQERARAIGQALDNLSAQQRTCLHLRIEGFRYREIARIVGVNTPTVSEYLRRAIARLREVIHE